MQYLQNNSSLQGGKYRIVRFLSSGGFGNTYEGVHTMMDTRVAIKEFFPKMFCNRDENTSHVTVASQGNRELVDKLRKKFCEEAKAIFKMNHPNIVKVHDIFEENGTAYYVMEYIDGESLSQIVHKRGYLPEQEAVRYITDTANALKYVHSLNRLHLDIKPANIMVGRDGRVMLIDFGVSKQYDEINGENTSTLMGYSAGYAPIEQQGNHVKTFTPTTDIYALGATFYSLLSGIMPPPNATDRADEDTLEPLPPIISTPVRNVIKKAMNVSRNGRIQSIDEFLYYLGASDSLVASLATQSKSVDERTYEYVSTSIIEAKTDKMKSSVHNSEETLVSKTASAFTPQEIYKIGTSIQDKRKAIKYYIEAAEQGLRTAQRKLGWCYLCGVGVEQNETKAIKWYAKAAEQGDHEAAEIMKQIKKHDLNSLYLSSKSSYGEKGIGFLVYVAKSGHAEAQFELSKCYEFGLNDFAKDMQKALEWCIKSAENGHIEAQYKLGYLYENGLNGVARDSQKAFELYSKAAEQGNEDAAQRVDALYKSLRKGSYAKTLWHNQKKQFHYCPVKTGQ